MEWRFGDVYGFNDVGGDKKNAFICEKPAPPEPSTVAPTTESGNIKDK